MILLEIIGLALLLTIWQLESNDTKKLGKKDALIRIVLGGLIAVGVFFLFIDILDFILEITG